MGRGTRNQPAPRERRRGGADGGGDASPVPPGGDDDNDGERIRYRVSVPLGMWEARLASPPTLRVCALRRACADACACVSQNS
jgi:hypothetical protein